MVTNIDKLNIICLTDAGGHKAYPGTYHKYSNQVVGTRCRDQYLYYDRHSAWLLFDDSNGSPENGEGYVWVFNTRELARLHAKHQRESDGAKLIGPFKYYRWPREWLWTVYTEAE